MRAAWPYVKRLAQRSEQIGFDLTLMPELNLNDIKGVEAPALDAWSTAAALAAVTERIELMVAVRPNFHQPALFAKQAANIDNISGGRLSLNVVSSWWADEAEQYGLQFDKHDDRYARTREWLDVVDGLWTEKRSSYEGERYRLKDAICEPKPAGRPRPTIYAGQWLSGSQLERELKLQEYSVSNRGLRPNLVGTPEQLRERIGEYEAAGLDLLLLQMSPQAEEMDRFAGQVIAPMRMGTVTSD